MSTLLDGPRRPQLKKRRRSPEQLASDALLGSKVCGKCGGRQPYANYSQHLASPDKRASTCKVCEVQRAQRRAGNLPSRPRRASIQKLFPKAVPLPTPESIAKAAAKQEAYLARKAAREVIYWAEQAKEQAKREEKWRLHYLTLPPDTADTHATAILEDEYRSPTIDWIRQQRAQRAWREKKLALELKYSLQSRFAHIDKEDQSDA